MTGWPARPGPSPGPRGPGPARARPRAWAKMAIVMACLNCYGMPNLLVSGTASSLLAPFDIAKCSRLAMTRSCCILQDRAGSEKSIFLRNSQHVDGINKMTSVEKIFEKPQGVGPKLEKSKNEVLCN